MWQYLHRLYRLSIPHKKLKSECSKIQNFLSTASCSKNSDFEIFQIGFHIRDAQPVMAKPGTQYLPRGDEVGINSDKLC
jgi:hypothetical protein